MGVVWGDFGFFDCGFGGLEVKRGDLLLLELKYFDFALVFVEEIFKFWGVLLKDYQE